MGVASGAGTQPSEPVGDAALPAAGTPAGGTPAASRAWWCGPFGVVALTLAVIAAGLHWSETRVRTVPAVPPPAGPVAAGSPAPAPSGTAVAAPAGTSVRFSFDGGLAAFDRPLPGQPALSLHTAEGGALTGVPHGSGTALAFPGPCADYGAASCPRAVLEAAGGNLSPGGRELRWGASVRLAADQTAPGSNVVQKGVSGGGGQFKLQVDGHAGRPSCVLVDSAAGSPSHVAKASVSIADDRWHALACTRDGTSLTVSVDGVPRGVVSVPDSLSVVNNDTLRIGGKGTSPNNDQFSGALDDVFVEIGW